MRDVLLAAARLLAMSWRQSRPKTSASAGLMLASGATMPLAALALRWLVDSANDGRAGEAAAAGVAAAFCVISALTLSHFAHIAYFELSELNVLRYDEELIALANGSAGLEAHEQAEHADRFTILDQEVRRTRMALQALLTAAELAVGTVLTAALLAALHPVLLLLPLAAVPPLLAGRRAERIVDHARTTTAEATRLALNLFSLATSAGPAKELRVLRLQEEVRRRHANLWQYTTDTLWRARRRAVVLRSLGQLVFVSGYVAAVLLIVREAIAGRQTVGDVVLVIVLAAQVSNQVAQAVGLLPDFERLAGVDRRLRELRDAIGRPATAGSADSAPTDRLRDGITLRGVSFAYPGTRSPVLRDVSLRLPAGCTVAVVGENGAGKTSLVKLLCGFYQPTTGHVLVDGTDLARIPVERWRARIAAGFQDFVRYELAAQQAVGVGDLPRADCAHAVHAALDRAQATDIVAQLPDGLATQLGTSYADGVELSGGQWQKLALGRAFMRGHPLLLVLDEPTSALDAETEHALFERYATQATSVASITGAITLLVSHRFSTVRMADLVVVVADGRVAEIGDHATLVRAGGLYAELYGLQAQAYR